MGCIWTLFCAAGTRVVYPGLFGAGGFLFNYDTPYLFFWWQDAVALGRWAPFLLGRREELDEIEEWAT